MHYKCTTPRHIGVGLTYVGSPNAPWSYALVVILALPSEYDLDPWTMYVTYVRTFHVQKD